MDEWTETTLGVPALGVIVDAGRGTLPYALIHGESLVSCAAWALGEAGVLPLDLGTPWAAVVAAEEPLVLHDALCPMLPADVIATCVRRATDEATVVVGVRPVTDTGVPVADAECGHGYKAAHGLPVDAT